MATVGRTTVCTIVPTNHFGAVPGVEVGTMWKFRVQVSEAGVHRPHVAGIAARESEGAFSIVLSGGYEDDVVSKGQMFLVVHLSITLGALENILSKYDMAPTVYADAGSQVNRFKLY